MNDLWIWIASIFITSIMVSLVLLDYAQIFTIIIAVVSLIVAIASLVVAYNTLKLTFLKKGKVVVRFLNNSIVREPSEIIIVADAMMCTVSIPIIIKNVGANVAALRRVDIIVESANEEIVNAIGHSELKFAEDVIYLKPYEHQIREFSFNLFFNLKLTDGFNIKEQDFLTVFIAYWWIGKESEELESYRQDITHLIQEYFLENNVREALYHYECLTRPYWHPIYSTEPDPYE